MGGFLVGLSAVAPGRLNSLGQVSRFHPDVPKSWPLRITRGSILLLVPLILLELARHLMATEAVVPLLLASSSN